MLNLMISFVLVPQIIYPPVPFHLVTFNILTTSIRLSCSLGVTIPSSLNIIWTHNGSPVSTIYPNDVIRAGNKVTLLIGNLQPSDAGVYHCTFTELNLNGSIELSESFIALYVI